MGNVQPRVQHHSTEEQAWVFELRVVQMVVLLWVILQVVVHLEEAHLEEVQMVIRVPV